MPRPSKKWFKLSKKLLASNKQFRLTGVIAVVAALAVVGAYFILHIHAATCTLGGDANCDGTVNVLDLSVVASNFGKTTGMTWSQGDFNGDGAVNVIDLSILAAHWGTGGTGGSAKCGLTNVAFCETFDSPAGTGNRSGQLNGTVWGVSRTTGNMNLGEPNAGGWAADEANPANHSSTDPVTTLCGQTANIQPDHDVAICNGEANEMTNDNTTVTTLAMYPKQPFDFAGRTGKVVFDVSDDTQGTHSAWPEFWMSDIPVPTPFTHENTTGGSTPKDGFGIRFGGACSPGQGPNCGPGPGCQNNVNYSVVGVDSAVIVRNYEPFDTFQGNAGTMTVTGLDCIKASTGPGNMNNIELDISQNQIDVYGTDAGTTSPLRHMAVINNANLTLSRGLIWMEDVHYNADKFNNERDNTFAWDNVGFDGPILPRDLAFDVNDHLVPGNGSTVELGWAVPADGTTLKLTVNGNITAANIANASKGLLTFNYYSFDTITLSYRLNGTTWHDIPWPFPDTETFGVRTYGLPINLSEMVPGTNTIELKASGGADIMNLDLIMVGAGGIVNP